MPPHRAHATTTNRLAFTALIWLSLLAILQSPLLAQNRTATEPPPPAIALADEPLELTSLGLTMLLPEGAIARTQSIGGVATTTIELPEGAGVVALQSKSTSRQDLALVEIETALVIQKLGIANFEQLDIDHINVCKPLSYGRGQLIGCSPVIKSQGGPLRPFYIRLPSSDDATPSAIQGYAILQTAVNEFVLFELLTTEPRSRVAQRQFEVSLGTLKRRDAGTIDEARGRAVRNAVEALNRLSEQDYRQIAESFGTSFERLYRPAATRSDLDAQEKGYRQMRTRIGAKGEISGKPRSRWSASEREEGLLLSVDARLLLDDGRRVDSSGMYFLSFDREEEVWSLEMAIRPRVTDRRQREEPEVWTETGVRRKNNLTVLVSSGTGAPRQFSPLIQGEGDVSRWESFLLPVLFRTAGASGELGVYAYDQNTETMRLKLHELSPDESRPGVWTMTTRDGDAVQQAATLDDAGKLIRAELESGLVWEPIRPERLRQLWRTKGLATD